ncbi:MAG: hypothetical protein AAGB06_02260 [Verrucomicrobiota bacterium]
MTLLIANLLVGIIVFATGAHFFFGNEKTTAQTKAFPRSAVAAKILLGASALWFIFNLSQLGEADFGNHRNKLMAVFGIGAVLSFTFVPDFLAVRGLAGLVLLGGAQVLNTAYMQWDHPQRLFMVSITYLGIGAAVYLGACPYKMRDWLEWIYAKPGRTKAIGGLGLGIGAALMVTAFTY